MSHGQPFRSVSKIQLSIMERNTCTPSFSPFQALFPKGRKSITFDIFLTVQNCIPCAVDPTSIWYIFLAYPDFSQGNCT